jgi:hypothetical protein
LYRHVRRHCSERFTRVIQTIWREHINGHAAAYKPVRNLGTGDLGVESSVEQCAGDVVWLRFEDARIANTSASSLDRGGRTAVFGRVQGDHLRTD